MNRLTLQKKYKKKWERSSNGKSLRNANAKKSKSFFISRFFDFFIIFNFALFSPIHLITRNGIEKCVRWNEKRVLLNKTKTNNNNIDHREREI